MSRRETISELTRWVESHAPLATVAAWYETLRLADEAERLHERDKAAAVHEDLCEK